MIGFGAALALSIALRQATARHEWIEIARYMLYPVYVALSTGEIFLSGGSAASGVLPRAWR